MARLKDQLRTDMTAAMKAKDKTTTTVLRAALAALTTAEVSGLTAHDLTDDQELDVLTKQVRQRKDSAQAYADGGRTELAEAELTEAAILQRYLPAPLTDAELERLVDDEIAAAGEVSLKQMGMIIKAVNAKAQGRAEGAKVAAIVKGRLSGR